MAVTVKKAVLWRRQLENRPGTLAEGLKPFADAGVNLQIVMGYTFPGDSKRAALEVYPVSNAKAEKAARAAGLSSTEGIPCLVVEGNDRAGLAYDVAHAMAQSGINLSFAVMQVAAKRYQAVFGFDSEKGANAAASLIKAADKRKSSTAKKKDKAKPAAKKAAKKPARKAAKTVVKKSAAKKTVAKKARRK